MNKVKINYDDDQFLVVLGAFCYFLSFFNVLTVRTMSMMVIIRQKTPNTAPNIIAIVPYTF